MRVVLDTNIWVSGLLLPKSTAGEILTAWQQAKFNLVISDPILSEIKKVLAYPKIRKRLQWDSGKIDLYLSLLKFHAEFISLEDIIEIKVDSDPDDSPILTILVTSQADYLVTGDDDLLNLAQKYPIIKLSDFHQRIA